MRIANSADKLNPQNELWAPTITPSWEAMEFKKMDNIPIAYIQRIKYRCFKPSFMHHFNPKTPLHLLPIGSSQRRTISIDSSGAVKQRDFLRHFVTWTNTTRKCQVFLEANDWFGLVVDWGRWLITYQNSSHKYGICLKHWPTIGWWYVDA